MSYNTNNPKKAARRHKPAIIAIIVAIGLAVLAMILFAPWGSDTEGVEVIAPGTDALAPDPIPGDAATAPAGTATTAPN
ncbi:hypothetical protein KTN05_14745 [Paracoccus sp. Z118]|uniref:hypothetical protein n=1 Tax=Paracoccus sp. Z118 TaxID=2851017 RepID=UPI001C2BBB04|nr:hypothetical protein [Paracoccus sp. Z118]MBV0893083.1 hypothetical protein [Paracoccus sp. Z118]